MLRSRPVRRLTRVHRHPDPTKLRSLRTVTVLLLAFLAGGLVPARAFAHGALRSASPADGDRLSIAPRELRLTFTEAVELAVSRLSLTGPDGSVALAPLTLAPDSATVLIGGIEGPLVAGTYTVNWQAVGADGHPVRGEYSFAVEQGAAGLTTAEPATAAPAPTAFAGTEEAGDTESSGSGTWLWILAAVVFGAIGWVALQRYSDRREDAGERA